MNCKWGRRMGWSLVCCLGCWLGMFETRVASQEPDAQPIASVILPKTLKEDTGVSPTPGWVILHSVATQPTHLRLSAEPPLTIPPTITVPPGQIAQCFWLMAGDDPWVSSAGRQIQVAAQAAGSPAVTSSLIWEDNDPKDITLTLSAEMPEGKSYTGQLTLKHPRQIPARMSIQSAAENGTNSLLEHPAFVDIPAFAREASFNVSVPDQAGYDQIRAVKLCVFNEDGISVCQRVIVAEDQMDEDGIEITHRGSAVSGTPTQLRATLKHVQLGGSKITVPGSIRFAARDASGETVLKSEPISFVNGVWTGSITLTGAALGLQVPAQAPGHGGTGANLDLFEGSTFQAQDIPLFFDPDKNSVIAFAWGQSPQPPSLTEIDLGTGQSVGSMLLPRNCRPPMIHRYAAGRLAWTTDGDGNFFRVNLETWAVDRELRPSPKPGVISRGMHPVPHDPESFVAVIAWDDLHSPEVILFSQGKAVGTPIPLNPSRNLRGFALGKAPQELFLAGGGELLRLSLSETGLTVEAKAKEETSDLGNPAPILAGDRLITSAGLILRPDSLADVGRLPTGFVPSVWIPEQQLLLCYDRDGVVSLNGDGDSLTPIGRHRSPLSATPQRLVRATNDWLISGATPPPGDPILAMFRCPLLSTRLPNLQLTLAVPSEIYAGFNDSPITLQTRLHWDFAVTNCSEILAENVVLVLDPGREYQLGALRPGQGVIQRVELDPSFSNIHKARAEVRSTSRDREPSDNRGVALTHVRPPSWEGWTNFTLAATDMAVTPPPTRLLVSISTEAGALSNSIAVLDPEGGQIERHLATEPDPRRLILTESGSQLYVVHGTNRVSCLALPDGRPEFNFLIPDGEAILEILPETGKGGGLIIGTTQSIAIYDRGAPRTKRVNAQASQRTLRAVGGAYWCAEPGRLRSFRVTAQGIEPDILSTPTIDPDLKDFTSDGQRLYFRNQSFSLTSKTRPARSIL